MSEIDQNKLVESAAHFIGATNRFIDALASAGAALQAFDEAMYHYDMRQKEIRHLKIKSYTLGLTYLEKQRLM